MSAGTPRLQNLRPRGGPGDVTVEPVTESALHRLVARYGGRGPRYTSYPTAAQFGPLDQDGYEERLWAAAARFREPWSLYVHIPFCQERCHFCACAVVATPQHDRVAPGYVDDLLAEMDLVRPRIRDRRGVVQLHLGGGTPTYLSPVLLDRLLRGIRTRFDLTSSGERSIELDPRVTTAGHLDVLAEHGINRVSIGVQDSAPEVQELIGRIQPLSLTRSVMEGARERGIVHLNLDLVYGLPGQTLSGIVRTVDEVLSVLPDRLALYGYAHVPWMRGNQRRIDAGLLPSADARLALFLAARERLEAAGYTSIGLDHFALATDPMARAYTDGTLRRNFMGYTVRGGTDMLGFGLTAIGDVSGALVQNTGKLSRYREAVHSGRLPVEGGVVRTNEDVLRGRVISDLMCRGRIHRPEIEREYSLSFDEHFSRELEALRAMGEDGLLTDDGLDVALTATGRCFVRTVAMAFDQYLGGTAKRHSVAV